MTYWLGPMVSGHGEGDYYLYDQSYRQVAKVKAGNGYRGDLHEFRLTSRGTALLTAYGTAHAEITSSDGRRRLALRAVLLRDRPGGRRRDRAGADAVASDEHVALDASYEKPPDSAAKSWDYFHINSIEVDPDDGNLIISGRNCWAFYKVDRHTGEVIWRCGGRDSDFRMGPGTTFRFQHHVVPHGHGVFTVFDNEGGPPQEESQSRGLVLHVDERHRRVRFLRALHHRPGVYSSALGSVQKLEHGGIFMGWGVSTWFTEYDRHGRVLLDARLEPVGVNSYRAFQNRWSGRPHWPPRIATERSGRRVTVYVSWNGATVHRSWQVLGGGHGADLQPIRTHAVDGFETAIVLDEAPARVAVRALDERGQNCRCRKQSAPEQHPGCRSRALPVITSTMIAISATVSAAATSSRYLRGPSFTASRPGQNVKSSCLGSPGDPTSYRQPWTPSPLSPPRSSAVSPR